MTENEIQEMAREMCDLSGEFKSCQECNEEYKIDDTLCFCQHMAKEIITHGYRKVECGEWITVNTPLYRPIYYKCSLCGYEAHDPSNGDTNFCPNCGADMRGNDNG